MLDATLWQVDMGDGTWAVCCLACRQPQFRGSKAEADRVFDSHTCEPIVPLTTPTGGEPGQGRRPWSGQDRHARLSATAPATRE
jgi:hypothetical protein